MSREQGSFLITAPCTKVTCTPSPSDSFLPHPQALRSLLPQAGCRDISLEAHVEVPPGDLGNGPLH